MTFKSSGSGSVANSDPYFLENLEIVKKYLIGDQKEETTKYFTRGTEL